MSEKSKYIGKTPQLVVVNIRNSKETVAILPTVSVKERGTNWSDSTTETHEAVYGRGSNLKEALNDLYKEWNEICEEEYGEHVYVSKAVDDFYVLKQ